MSGHPVGRADWATAVVGLLLLIDLLKLPWHSGSSETISGIVITHSSTPATGSPDGWLGLLAVLATLTAVVDLAVKRHSPQTRLPSIAGSRLKTRYALAIAAAAFMALKFILHVDQVGELGVGFWLGVGLAAAFVFAAGKARAPGRPAQSRDAR